VSRTSELPTWTSWLDDWKHNAGAKVEVFEQQQELELLEDHKVEIQEAYS